MKCKNPNCTTKTVNWLSKEDLSYLDGLCFKCVTTITAQKIADWKAEKRTAGTGCPF